MAEGIGARFQRRRRKEAPRLLGVRHTTRAILGIAVAPSALAAAGFTLLAAGAAPTGITITPGPCSGGGTSFCFSPEAAALQAGAPVTWDDQSGVEHEIARCTPSACPGSPASTGSNTFDVAVPANGHGSFTFTAAGTYYYYCTIHGYAAMHGSITVAAAATPPPTPSATPRPTARPTARPTPLPSMKSARPTPTAGAAAPSRPAATPIAARSATAVATPDVVPSAAISPSIAPPSPHAVALVGSGGSPALPITVAVIVLLAATGTWYMAFRRHKRQLR